MNETVFSDSDHIRTLWKIVCQLAARTGYRFTARIYNESGDFIMVDSMLSGSSDIQWLRLEEDSQLSSVLPTENDKCSVPAL